MSQTEMYATPKKPNKVLTIPASPLLTNLGYGTGVSVYRFQRNRALNDSKQSPWALKKINKEGRNKKLIRKRLLAEADILRKLSHPNIVGFRMFTRTDAGDSCLLMEDCEKSLGDLIEERFEASPNSPFPSNLILKVAGDIANALNYLHNTARILHGDIKSHNVLVKGEFQICKLCDFGITLSLNSDGTLDQTKEGDLDSYEGTISWVAREILQYPPIITDKADIYAYGLVLWEMLALIPPPVPEEQDESSVISLLSENEDSFLSENDEIAVKSSHSRPDLPLYDFSNDYNYVLEIFYCTTDNDYTKRPKAADLVIVLEEIVKGK